MSGPTEQDPEDGPHEHDADGAPDAGGEPAAYDGTGPDQRADTAPPGADAGPARPRIPLPRPAADDLAGDGPPPVPGGDRIPRRPLVQGPIDDHQVLTSLLGAWALAACSTEETDAVELHLTDCANCAEEALRLRDAVGLLRPEHSLDLDPRLRARVLAGCLSRRPARVPVPPWAAPYDAETARLDALLHDMAAAEWRAPVELRWFDGVRSRSRTTTVAGVIGHLLAVDGLAATVLNLPDPLDVRAPLGDPTARTEAYWESIAPRIGPEVRGPWRAQTRALINELSLGRTGPDALVGYGTHQLPLRDALLDRAFECWIHAADIAEAIHYPHHLPASEHLALLVDLAVRQLPESIATRRRAGLSPPVHQLTSTETPGRTLHLEIEGSGGGHWYIPLDSPGAATAEEEAVAHVALDGMEFCQLVAGHVSPDEAAAGARGDKQAISDVLYATASLSRM